MSQRKAKGKVSRGGVENPLVTQSDLDAAIRAAGDMIHADRSERIEEAIRLKFELREYRESLEAKIGADYIHVQGFITEDRRHLDALRDRLVQIETMWFVRLSKWWRSLWERDSEVVIEPGQLLVQDQLP